MGPGSALAVLACPGRQRVCCACVAISRHSFAFSRHDLPELCKNILPRKGSRECRVHAAPAVSCAKLCEDTHTSIQVQRKHSGIPRAMALRLISRSPATNSSCHRRCRLDGEIESGWIEPTTDSLAPATGVGTTRFCRTLKASFVLRAVVRSRKTALRTHTRRRQSVHRILSRVRDDRDTPLLPGKDGASW
jgi:hypothetical protein